MLPLCDLGSTANMEHRWRHVQHHASGCPLVPPLVSHSRPASASSTLTFLLKPIVHVRHHLPFTICFLTDRYWTLFAPLPPLDLYCSCWILLHHFFLFAGRVPCNVMGVYSHIVAGFVVGVASKVRGGASVPLAEAMRRWRLRELCGVASLLVPISSSSKGAGGCG